MNEMLKPSFAIVGCGKVGTILGKFLAACGYRPAGLSSKSLSSALKAAEIIGTDLFGSEPWEQTRQADVVFMTTPDGLIEETCTRIADQGGFKADAIVLHCSGALSSDILSTAKTCGAGIGSMHPLQSFASADYEVNPFQDIIVAVEGEDAAVGIAAKIAGDLGAKCLEIKTEAKTLYHASAVVASNYLVTLMDLSFQLIGEAGISAQDAFNVLAPLVKGTLANIERIGITEALTGPIARGDVETVAGHVKEIAAKRPDLQSLYQILGTYTIGIAHAKGSLEETAADKLKSILEKTQ